MKNRFNSVSETGLKYSLYLLFLFPLLPLKWAGIFLFLFVVFSILTFSASKERVKLNQTEKLFFLAFLALPVFYLLELAWADNVDFVWRILQRKLGLILIPMAFFFLKRSGYQLNTRKYFDVYIAGVFILVLYTVGTLLINGISPEHLENSNIVFALRTDIENIAHLHPTYFGLIVSLALLLLTLKVPTMKGNQLMQGLSVVMIFSLFVFLFALASRMAIFACVLALLATIFRQEISSRIKWSIAGGIVVGSVLLVLFVPSIQSRVFELFNNTGYNSTSLRMAIYQCGLRTAEQNWILGTSIEQLQTVLNQCYQSSYPELFVDGRDYNTHNEFLNVLNAKGVLGLSLFLAPIGFFIRKSRYSNAMLIFTILICCIFMTENILERQIGVFFYPLYGFALFLFKEPYSVASADSELA